MAFLAFKGQIFFISKIIFIKVRYGLNFVIFCSLVFEIYIRAKTVIFAWWVPMKSSKVIAGFRQTCALENRITIIYGISHGVALMPKSIIVMDGIDVMDYQNAMTLRVSIAVMV